ncbi:MAG: hypothetical protein K0R00_128 [Herbinix sp.]|nr:hypothetical protein [Herbinix sp.]
MSEIANKIQVVPSVFAEATFQLDGRPFRLTDRHYLKPIYDADIEEGIIMSGRQVEKSTTNSTMIGTLTLTKPHFKALYFAPLTSQVREFSKERIGKIYEYSQDQVVKNNFIGKQDSQAVQFKEFNNGSINYFKHCFGMADNIRGITVNGVWGDEIQDIHIDAIPVIKETQSHALDAGARMRVTWYTGTPKTFSNTIQQYWDRSTQNEWIVKCPHCNTHQVMGIKNLEPTRFVCRKCKRDLPKASIINGFWYELQPDRKLKGFRISQLMVPWIQADDIWAKYTTYSSDKFHNEVLGRSYENADKPFTSLVLAGISTNDLKLYPRAEREFSNTKNFMGVDWGTGEKSFTVVTIYSYNSSGRFQMIFNKRYEKGEELDPDWQLRDICNLMNLFRIAYAIVDWGFGFVQYKKLRALFGSRVAACYYSFNQNQKAKYNPQKTMWVVNRTEVMQQYITAVHKKEILWPGSDRSKYSWLYDHHLVELAEYRKAQSGKSEDLFYTHPEGQPDDGLHSCVYAYLAAKLYGKGGGGGTAVEFSSAYGGTI